MTQTTTMIGPKLIKFLDLSVKDPEESKELKDAFAHHLESGRFIISDNGDRFETEFAHLIGRKFCIGINTGTDALTIGLRLLDLPLGSKIITSPFSWVASATSILLAGLTPIFLDIGDDLQLDLNQVENYLRTNEHKVKALLIPHLHGNVSNLSHLMELRSRYGLKIVEDCAQAYGAYDTNKALAGSVGDVAAFSFNPMKVLGALGDAGALVFDEATYLNRARSLRHSGMVGSEGSISNLTWNCRLDALQSSLLLVRMRYFTRHWNRRKQVASIYNEGLSKYLKIITQDINRSNHYTYQTLAPNRDELQKYLSDQGIETRVRHNFLIPDHPIFRAEGPPIPKARELVDQSLCIPMHHHMSDNDAAFIVSQIQNFYSTCGQ
jgi:dTDP-4-amino-4,6-dideoxygalactose transaminase